MFERKCPSCGKILWHTMLMNVKRAEKLGTKCRSCSQHDNASGSRNNMYGRSLHSVWIEKYGQEEGDRRLKEYGNKRIGKKLNRTPQGRENSIRRGADNAMFGKTLEQLMLRKYGAIEGPKRIAERRMKMSKHMSGSGNPMYGKPSPTGSGNGWSGWFDGHYFRSLLELSYLKHLIDNHKDFESGECARHGIQYVDSLTGKDMTYFPDFILKETGEVIEVKPKNLLRAVKNVDKHSAARKKFGDKFMVITEESTERLTDAQITELHDSGRLKFLDRYELKYKQRRGA